ncbi:MAG: transcriptional repressor LexA [Thermomicrobiales bacterium]|nr:transcriptional repressor LexA [Thermomicrobiales bacterium]MCO5218410.1 transcriptional repressor LexA [Thermomicrobiales bacterium]MCO5223841.1 transcriptional repressor LexA [Thermomicrobiales bacterium]MCO5229264.1 transcriptional repressor LexA [Thermomicrobiales bacterium]
MAPHDEALTMKKLSERQQAVLDYIAAFLDQNDYPPTIRDIKNDLGISSTSVVDYNLKVLEERDLIRRNRNISRGIELVGRVPQRAGNTVSVKIVGQIAAGLPIEVPEVFSPDDVLGRVEVSPEIAPRGGEDLFALKVKGLSMIDALINDGDIVVLRQQSTCENGETVAVWLEAERETTLKKLYREGAMIRLQPANVTMDPIYTSAENVRIQGKLVGVVRQID